MTNEELAEIRQRHEARRVVRQLDAALVANAPGHALFDGGGAQAMADFDALLAEVERLTAERPDLR
jgi:hypothetical protein